MSLLCTDPGMKCSSHKTLNGFINFQAIAHTVMCICSHAYFLPRVKRHETMRSDHCKASHQKHCPALLLLIYNLCSPVTSIPWLVPTQLSVCSVSDAVLPSPPRVKLHPAVAPTAPPKSMVHTAIRNHVRSIAQAAIWCTMGVTSSRRSYSRSGLTVMINATSTRRMRNRRRVVKI